MSFWEDNGNLITAGITLAVTLAAAKGVDTLIVHRGKAIAGRAGGGEVSASAETRLRLLRRVVIAVIILIGVALALTQFASVKRLATGILASSAVIGLIVGLAARQMLANAFAGMILAITQPIRIGDRITWQDHDGRVEDMHLNYTYLRKKDGSRVVIPNGLLAESPVENHTIIDRAMAVEVSLWLPLASNLERARALLEKEIPECSTEVAELDKDYLRLEVRVDAASPTTTEDTASDLRRRCLTQLRNEGLLPSD